MSAEAVRIEAVSESAPDQSSRFVRDAHALVRDLMTPDPLRYWVDFLATVCVMYSALGLALRPSSPIVVTLAAMVVSSLAMYRAIVFTHEIAHRTASFRGFALAWNVLCGIPLLVPSFLYGDHKGHHANHLYGTWGDPEYLVKRIAIAAAADCLSPAGAGLSGPAAHPLPRLDADRLCLAARRSIRLDVGIVTLCDERDLPSRVRSQRRIAVTLGAGDRVRGLGMDARRVRRLGSAAAANRRTSLRRGRGVDVPQPGPNACRPSVRERIGCGHDVSRSGARHQHVSSRPRRPTISGRRSGCATTRCIT